MKAAAHLFPCSFTIPQPAAVIVPSPFVQGRQFGVDTTAYGKPYVFSRVTETAMWMVHAGPFVDVAAAERWIQALK